MHREVQYVQSEVNKQKKNNKRRRETSRSVQRLDAQVTWTLRVCVQMSEEPQLLLHQRGETSGVRAGQRSECQKGGGGAEEERTSTSLQPNGKFF